MTGPDAELSLGYFDLIEPIGSGGMAEVWSARHRSQGTPVAVKVLSMKTERLMLSAVALRREIRSVAGLNHPGIITVLDTGDVPAQAEQASRGRLLEGSPYLVMELAHAGSLSKQKKQHSWAAIRRLLIEVLEALGHAHARGFVHRDIKPANILVHSDLDLRPGTKLTDFGIAQHLRHPDEGGPTGQEFARAGTPPYTAPEVFTEDHHLIGPWTDLYSLGCVAYKLISGFRPFQSRDPAGIAYAHLFSPVPELLPATRIPDGVDDWVRRMLAKLPEDRFQRAADAVLALRDLDLVPETDEWKKPPADDSTELHLETTEVLHTVVTLATETEPLQQVPPSIEAQDSENRQPDLVPPVPPDWRARGPRSEPIELVGAGLGLYGLRPIPTVAREAERDTLWATLRRVSEEQSVETVLFEGPSGTGKTHLVRWFCQRAEELGCARALGVTHTAYEGPNDGVAPMLARELRCSQMDTDQATLVVEAFAGSHGIEHLRELLVSYVCPASAYSASLSTGSFRFSSPEQNCELVGSVLSSLARRRPIILWIDDAQWGHEALLLVEALNSRGARHRGPILCVVSARDDLLAERRLESEQIDALRAADSCTRFRLDELLPEDGRTLIRQLLPLEETLAGRVLERSGGVPAHAVQLVGDWVERGILEVTDSGFTIADEASTTIPDSIHATVEDRLRRLLAPFPEDCRKALEILAALGGQASEAEWEAVCRLSKLRRGPAFTEALEKTGIAANESSVWRLRWNMMAESLARQARASGSWRRHHHHCAEMLSENTDPPALGVAARRGLHLLEAENWDGAVAQLLVASQETRSTGDFERGLALLERCETALTRSGRSSADADWGRRLVLKSNLVRRARKDHSAATAPAEEAVTLARKHGWDDVLAEGLRCVSIMRAWEGRLQESLDAADEAHRIYEAIGNREGIADIMRRKAEDLNALGRLDEAVEWSRRSVEVYQELEPGPGLLTAMCAHCRVLERLGRHEEAMEVMAPGEALITDCVLPVQGIIHYLTTLAAAFIGQGQFRKARELFQRGRLRARESAVLDVGLLNRTAELHRMLGEFPEARALYEEAMEVVRESRFLPNRVWLELNLCILRVQEGDYLQAKAEAAQLAHRYQGDQRTTVQIGLALVPLPGLCAAGDWDLLARQLAQIEPRLEPAEVTDYDFAILLEATANLCRDAGRLPEAQTAYRLAITQWSRLRGQHEATKRCTSALSRL
ncbi:MAG: tetratricopeptide repeat protein [Myxococcota bacterium]|nr:tetratricopeptide repeat protein [Myxococcota bacterium]